MLKHIVMWKLKEENKQETMNKLEAGIREVARHTLSLKSLEVGRNITDSDMAYDMVLIMEFDDEKGLQEYLAHLKHDEFSAYCKTVREARMVVDYIVT